MGHNDPLPTVSRSTLLFLVLMTAVAAAVRSVGLNGQLWYDEIASLLHSFRPSVAHIVTHYESNNNHPLYSLLAHAAIALFGEHPWSVRLPALLFGVAGIPAAYLLGREVTSNREAALASTLLAVSYHHAWFSQNARGYTALAFFATLCTWLLLRGMRGGMSCWWLGYALAAGLGAYTHATMVFIATGHALALAAWLALVDGARRRLLPAAAAAFAGSAALAALCYAPMFGELAARLTQPPKTGSRVFASPRGAIQELLLELAGALGHHVAVTALAALALGMAGVGLVSYWRRSSITAVVLLLPAVVTTVGVMVLGRPMHPRFLFFMVVAGALFFVRGLFAGIGFLRRRWSRSASMRGSHSRLETMLAMLAIGANLPPLALCYRLPKQDYLGALQDLARHAGANDAICVVGITAAVPLQRYYGRRWPQVARPEELMHRMKQGRRVWVVYTIPRYLERGSFEVRAVFKGTLAGGEVVVCASRNDKALRALPPRLLPAAPKDLSMLGEHPHAAVFAWDGSPNRGERLRERHACN